MHKCTGCGAEFEGKFCPDCGTLRDNLILCPKCFAEIKQGARYCTECGLKQGAEKEEAKETEETEAAETAEETAEDTQNTEQAAETESSEAAGDTESSEEKAEGGETEKTVETDAEQPEAEETEKTVETEESEEADEAAPAEETEAEEAKETEEPKEEKEEKPKLSKFGLLRRALYFAPAALFSLLAVMLWGFYAAPAAVYDKVSYGDVYKFAGAGNEVVDIRGCAGALIAFAAIAVLLAAFALTAKLYLPLASKKFNISAARFRLTFAVDCAQGAVCFALFVTAAALCAKANSSVSETGAAGALALSFALVFMLLIAGALVADFVLRKRVPAYAEAAARHEQTIDSRAEQKAKRIADSLASLSGGEAPEYQRETNKRLAFCLYWLEKGKAFLRMYAWLGIILGCALVAYNFHYDRTTDLMNNSLLVAARIFVAAVIALALGIAVHMLVPYRVPDRKRLASLRTGYVIRAVWSGVLFLGILAYAFIGLLALDGISDGAVAGPEVLGITYAGVIVSVIFLSLVPLALSITNIVLCGKLTKKYFPRAEDGSYGDDLAPLAERKESRKAYVTYLYDKNRNARRAAAGKGARTAKQYKKERALIAAFAIAAAFAVAAAIFFTVIFVPRNVYKLGKIESISVGDNAGYVYRTLGAPSDKEEPYGNTEVWVYCSDSLATTIAKKTRRLEQLKSQMSWENVDRINSLEQEITALEAKLANRRCNYIFVTVQGGTVTGVRFEKNRRRSEETQPQVTKITYACETAQTSAVGVEIYKSYYCDYAEKPTVSRFSVTGGSVLLNVREYFSDGSLINKTINVSAQSKTGLQEAEWSDAYGTHTIYMSVR